MKRIFIQRLIGSMVLDGATDYSAMKVFDSYVAEEDITIIGVRMHGHFPTDNVAVDGMSETLWAVSLDGTVSRKNICMMNVTEHYLAVVGAQQRLQYQWADEITMFPAGHGVTMREGETIYLIGDARFPNSLAVVVASAWLFHIKGI